MAESGPSFEPPPLTPQQALAVRGLTAYIRRGETHNVRTRNAVLDVVMQDVVSPLERWEKDLMGSLLPPLVGETLQRITSEARAPVGELVKEVQVKPSRAHPMLMRVVERDKNVRRWGERGRASQTREEAWFLYLKINKNLIVRRKAKKSKHAR